MGACCFSGVFVSLFDDCLHTASSSQRPQRRSTRRPPQASSSSTAPAPRQHSVEHLGVCDVCGTQMDTTLLHGHRETCRINQMRRMTAAQHAARQQRATAAHDGDAPSSMPRRGSGASGDNDADDDAAVSSLADDQQCVVCLDQMREYAFIPCGHVVCCEDCAKRLEECPLCRQPRLALCHVPLNILSQYLCKHCQHFIAPTLYEGHREVCAHHRQQQQQQQLLLRAHVANTSTMAADTGDKVVDRATTPLGVAVSCDTKEREGGAVAASTDDNDAASIATGSVCAASAVADVATAGAADATDAVVAVVATADDDDTNKATDAVVTTSDGARWLHVPSTLCVECQRAKNKLVICLPCGHRVLCSSCAAKLATCPVCLVDIRSTLLSYQ